MCVQISPHRRTKRRRRHQHPRGARYPTSLRLPRQPMHNILRGRSLPRMANPAIFHQLPQVAGHPPLLESRVVGGRTRWSLAACYFEHDGLVSPDFKKWYVPCVYLRQNVVLVNPRRRNGETLRYLIADTSICVNIAGLAVGYFIMWIQKFWSHPANCPTAASCGGRRQVYHVRVPYS